MITLFSLPVHNKRSVRSGFTLIELLLVIAIIGILATLITANFVGVRQRARDTQRKSDLRQIQSALELYKSDAGVYPVSTGSGYSLTGTSSCSNSSRVTFAANNVTYMSKVPCDPLGSGTAFNGANYYYYSTAGATYVLAACLENNNDGDVDSTATPPSPTNGSCSGKYYILINP